MRDRRVSPRRKVATIAAIAVGLVVLVTGLPALARLYVDLRWFRSLGFEQAFTTVLSTELLLGTVTGALLGLILVANVLLATRLSRGLSGMRLRDMQGVARVDLAAMAPRVLVGIALLVGVLGGISASDHWQTWLQYLHGSEFGERDPIFGRDIGFYVFTLPLLETLRTFLFWALGLSALLSAVTYVVRGGLELAGRPIRADRRARAHLSAIAALVFVLLAYDAWLSTAGLLYSTVGPVAGASYTDVNATLPALRIQIATALVAAALIGVSITRKKLLLVYVAVALYAIVALLGVRIYPGAVHRFSVLPNEADKEAPFIAHNIEATRNAYGLASVVERNLSGELSLTAADIEANQATIDNVRLWDHQPLLDTFAQIQEIRTYYEFVSVDNDRYEIDGAVTQTMLSPRELAVDSLPNRTWINEAFTFTHGAGITLGPVNRATGEGLPALFVRDIPPVSTTGDIQVTRAAIYYGELVSPYVFVNTRAREFDYPAGDENVYAEYEGRGGVRLDSTLTVTAVSLHIGSLKLLLSDDITERSRVLLYRNIQERVQRLAPFLQYDRDPYMVVRDDGTLVWIQDAYTTTNRYPYAQPMENGVNYLRNSVKAVIDAYDGSVTFYVADESDPVLRTWRRAFPELFTPLDRMPRDLRAHLRYPEDLFRMQTEMYTVYHMDSPELVYNREDQWEFPQVTVGDTTTRVEPYYTIMRLPGERQPEFILMLPFTPKRKQNLAAWMVARMDGEQLGQLVVYVFPKRRTVFGPSQIMNRINQDAEISRQVSLWDQRGSQVIFGTLLVIPIEESLIYVCPLYLRSSGGRIPELKRVIVAHENRIVMGETLDEAVASLFRIGPEVATGPPPTPPATEPGAETPPPAGEPGATAEPAPPPAETAADRRRLAKQHYDRAVAAQRRGDWAAYGEELRQLGEVLEELAGQPPAPP